MRILLLLILLSSCRSASWHIEQAQKKDPSMFKDSTSQIQRIKTPSAYFAFNCDDLRSGPMELHMPRTYKDSQGNERTDTVTIYLEPQLSPEDSSKIAEIIGRIDCPPTEKETITVPPIILKPTFWDKLKLLFIGFVGGLVITVLFYLSRR